MALKLGRRIISALIADISLSDTMVDKQRYVEKSSYRVSVLKAIGDDVKIPKKIASDSGVLPNHLSNVLRELKEKELVECINPEVRKGRLYRLTEEGSDILDRIE